MNMDPKHWSFFTLGVPVEPLVYMMIAVSSAVGLVSPTPGGIPPLTLGVPVEPLVYMMMAVSSAVGLVSPTPGG